MCMAATVRPTPMQSAPQVTPPTQSPDGGATGQGAAAQQRKRAMVAAAMGGAGRATPLGQAITTNTLTGGLLG